MDKRSASEEKRLQQRQGGWRKWVRRFRCIVLESEFQTCGMEISRDKENANYL